MSAQPEPVAPLAGSVTLPASMPRTVELSRPVVVVTGPPRSGTSVIGKLLTLAPGSIEVYEPLNPQWGLVGVERVFPYLRRGSTAGEAEALWGYLRDGSVVWRNPQGPIPNGKRTLVRRRLIEQSPAATAVVKDPFLVCALDWVHHDLSDRPAVVTLRHPAAWMASLNRRRMSAESILRGLAAQPDLTAGPLADVLEPWIAGKVASRVHCIGLAWSALVRMIDVQVNAGAPVLLTRMEDFGRAPLDTVTHLFASLGLDPPPDLEQRVAELTEADTVVPPPDVMHEHRRNSAELATAWRGLLSDDDVRQLRKVVEPHAWRHYPEW